MNVIITGGSGFIGSALVRFLLQTTGHTIINIDKLTYAVNPKALEKYQDHSRYIFVQGDICDRELTEELFHKYQPTWIIHLAAESHVDKSIYASSDFIQTNIVGTYNLLETSLGYWHLLNGESKKQFRFLHISTDEVYGDLGLEASHSFNETSPYKPSSPYSASKASSDHLVKAWYRTYGLPTIITHCSNNYGPYQHPEKLIPKTISRAIEGLSLPIYGTGEQVRDWIHVDDHTKALLLILQLGEVGETYCIGSNCEKSNLEVVNLICCFLNQIKPKDSTYTQQIKFVADREGHDQRYAINSIKIRSLGWKPEKDFEQEMKTLIIRSLKSDKDIEFNS